MLSQGGSLRIQGGPYEFKTGFEFVRDGPGRGVPYEFSSSRSSGLVFEKKVVGGLGLL